MKGDKAYWTKIVSKILRAELAKRDISYSELSQKLEAFDIKIQVGDLAGRISRGTFSAALLIQCLKAIGVKNLLLEDSFFEV
jgi:hypothetical protein